jgi:hypothetical protein
MSWASENLAVLIELYVPAFSPTVCMQLHIHMAMQRAERVPGNLLLVLSVNVITRSKLRKHHPGKCGARNGI